MLAMRLFLATFFIIVYSISNLNAQVDYYEETEQELFRIGPYLQLKAGINGGLIPEGRQNAIAFNGIPDFGATCYVPLSLDSDLAATFDLGMSSYSFFIKNVHTGAKYQQKYSYMNLAMNFHLYYVLMGFNFGIPLSADMEGSEIASDQLQLMAEFRIGGIIPLMQDEDGSLNVMIYAGYMLTGIYSDFAQDDPLKNIIVEIPPDIITQKQNPRAISISIGLNYMFNFYNAPEEE
jgi:hypothetical protein